MEPTTSMIRVNDWTPEESGTFMYSRTPAYCNNKILCEYKKSTNVFKILGTTVSMVFTYFSNKLQGKKSSL